MSDSVKYLQQKEILKKSRSNIITWNNLIIRNSFSFFLVFSTKNLWGFPGGSDSKESDCNAGDTGSIPGSGRSPREGNGYALQYSFFFFFSLQYSCLENSMDREAWQTTIHGVAMSWTWLSDWVCMRVHTHTHTSFFYR